MAPPQLGSNVATEPNVVMPSTRWPSASNTGAQKATMPGITTLGPAATFDPNWDGAVATPLRAAARQLSADLGWSAP